MLTKQEKVIWLRQLRMPVTYPAIYLDMAAARGVAAETVLQTAGLRANLLADPSGRVSPQEYVQLVKTVVLLTGDEGIGFDVGEHQPLTAHGSLGYALMCCSSVAEAVIVLQRFWHVRGRGIRMTSMQQGEWLIFEFKEEMAMDPAVRRVLFDAMMSGFYHSLRFALGETAHIGELWFDYVAPDYMSRYSHRLPPIRYQMPVSQLRVPISINQRRLLMANPEALALAIAQCERESVLLEQTQSDVLTNARNVLLLSEHGYPHPDELASRLYMSTRTLRRRLHMQGSSYQQLLDDARRRDALALLDKANLEIQKVAALLGYNNPANFTRAFKEWTGRTPSQYRALRQLN
jgi:AraC-like DNA-binding protein